MEPDFDLSKLQDVPDPLRGGRGAPSPASAPRPRALEASELPEAPTRARQRKLRWIAAGGVVLYEALLLTIVGLRPDLRALPRAAVPIGVSVPLACALLALAAAKRTGAGGVGRASTRVAGALFVLVGLFAISTLFSGHGARVLSGRAYWTATALCVVGSTLFTAGPLMLATFAFRRSFPSAAVWRTAALGLACGAVAIATMDMRCDVDGPLHMLLGHGVALVLGGLAGLGLTRFTRA